MPLAIASTRIFSLLYNFLELGAGQATPSSAIVSLLKEEVATRASIWAAARSGAAIGSLLPWKAAGTAGGFIVGAGIGYFTGLTVEEYVKMIWRHVDGPPYVGR